jgi:hypothetical protein
VSADAEGGSPERLLFVLVPFFLKSISALVPSKPIARELPTIWAVIYGDKSPFSGSWVILPMVSTPKCGISPHEMGLGDVNRSASVQTHDVIPDTRPFLHRGKSRSQCESLLTSTNGLFLPSAEVGRRAGGNSATPPIGVGRVPVSMRRQPLIDHPSHWRPPRSGQRNLWSTA